VLNLISRLGPILTIWSLSPSDAILLICQLHNMKLGSIMIIWWSWPFQWQIPCATTPSSSFGVQDLLWHYGSSYKQVWIGPGTDPLVPFHLKSCRSTAVTGGSVPTQGRSGYVHSNQNHLKRKALLNRLRSSIPNPPNRFGLIVLAQLTRQLPPLASASPLQSKLIQVLSIFLIAHFCNLKNVRK
jgi:hypothetical protein